MKIEIEMNLRSTRTNWKMNLAIGYSKSLTNCSKMDSENWNYSMRTGSMSLRIR